MDKRNNIEVIINDKRYTLSGYESEDYFHKVAAHINNKIAELREHKFYSLMENDMKNVLIQINLADDYFKTKKLADETSRENEDKNDEIYILRHDLMLMQTKLETIQEELAKLKEAYIEEQKKTIKLETELAERSKNGNRTDSKGNK